MDPGQPGRPWYPPPWHPPAWRPPLWRPPQWRPPQWRPPYPGILSPDAPAYAVARLRVLAVGQPGAPGQPGQPGAPATSTVTLVRDGAALIVVNPGAVASSEAILRPLREAGVLPAAVTDVVALCTRPAHMASAALFPGARLHSAAAIRRGHGSARHRAGGFAVSPSVRLIGVPGSGSSDLTALVATPDGIVALTHLWRSPADGSQPAGREQAALRRARLRVLGIASRIVPAHGPAFRAGPDTPV